MGRPIRWTKAKKKKAIEKILDRVRNSESVNKILLIADRKEYPTPKTFDAWLAEDENLELDYARAREARAESMFEEMIDIADTRSKDVYKDKDGFEQIDHNVINRDRLRITTRQWNLARMQPKKYGDSSLLKIAGNEGQELKVNALFPIDLIKDVLSNDSTKEDS